MKATKKEKVSNAIYYYNIIIDNYHKFAVLELEDQRKAIKTQQREALAELLRKKALEEKAIEAKKNAK